LGPVGSSGGGVKAPSLKKLRKKRSCSGGKATGPWWSGIFPFVPRKKKGTTDGMQSMAWRREKKEGEREEGSGSRKRDSSGRKEKNLEEKRPLRTAGLNASRDGAKKKKGNAESMEKGECRRCKRVNQERGRGEKTARAHRYKSIV